MTREELDRLLTSAGDEPATEGEWEALETAPAPITTIELAGAWIRSMRRLARTEQWRNAPREERA